MKRPDIKLGDKARDSISGFVGVVVAITEWLNGCQRILIQPQMLHEGKPVESQTFDAEQVEVVLPEPVVKPSRTGGPPIKPTRNADPS